MRKTIGYSDQVELLDFFEPKNTELIKAITLIKTGSISYFTPSGKARMKLIFVYRVDVLELDDDLYNELDSKRFTTKRDAKAYYKHLIHRTKLAEIDRKADKSINYGVL